MKRSFIIWQMLLLTSLLAARTFKFATITPENSPWTNTMRELAAELAEKTDNRVKLKIYSGGVAGEESDVLRKIKIGQIDGTLLSAMGAVEISPSSLIMSLPFMIENDEQMKIMLNQAHQFFDAEAEKNGYKMLLWSFSGWVHLFSQQRLQSVDDIKKVNIAAGDNPDLIAAWSAVGADVRSIAFFDIPTGMQNGLVDTFYNSPAGAVAYQWFSLASYMTEIPIAPLIGAVAISMRKWSMISNQDQQIFSDLLQRAKEQFENDSIDLDNKAKAIMLDKGLQIPQMSAEDRAGWRNIFVNKGYPAVIGEGHTISPRLLEEITSLLGR